MKDAIEVSCDLKMDQPDTADILDQTVQGVIAKPTARPEGALKVSGHATYADEDHPPGTVFGWFARATIGKGWVTGMNRAEVRAMPGVLDIITDARLLRNPAQGMANKAPVQGPAEIAYRGQPIALIVAETLEQARDGALSLRAEYVDQTDKAVFAPDKADYETPPPKQAQQGDLDAAMMEAAFTVDQEFYTPSMSHSPMEPHAAVAWWDGSHLTVRGSYQMLAFNVAELADSLGIAKKNVRILAPYVGGGFGGKLGIGHEAVAAAIASKRLGRPVAVVLHRRQVYEATTRRSESRQRVRLAADAGGRLTGIGHEAWVSNLPRESFSEPVTQATPFTYAGDNRLIGHHVGRVNVTCAGSMRAPGEAIGVPVVEMAMDELAEAIGICPIELRLRNIPDQDPSTGKAFSSNRLADCMTRGAETFGWDQRPAPGTKRDGEWLIGMGVAAAVRVNMLQPSQARITLLADGTARVETDMTDIGTGSYSILTQIAAEMLGLPLDRISTVLGDSDLPASSGSGGSFGAASAGSAVLLAAKAVRNTLADRLQVSREELTLKDGYVIAGNIRTSLADVLQGDSVVGKGDIKPGSTEEDQTQACWGAQFAEVAVSTVTGEVHVRRMSGVFASGRVLNPTTARSQCLGGMIFGQGSALTEEVIIDPRNGSFVNRDLGEYHIPVHLDVPHIEVDFLEDRDPYANPMQAKGIGEVACCGMAGAIVNAIANATGKRFRSLPVTLDKVLAELG